TTPSYSADATTRSSTTVIGKSASNPANTPNWCHGLATTAPVNRPGTTESGTDNPSVNTSDATGNEALDSPAWLTARRSGPHSRETTLAGRSPTVTIAVPGLPATMPASVLIGTERIELQERPVPVPEP